MEVLIKKFMVFMISFREVWKIDKNYVLLNLLLTLLTPVQLNASIYLGAQLINNISKETFVFSTVVMILIVIIALELLVHLFTQLKSKYSISFIEKFNIYQKTKLADHHYYATSLVEKENPQFHGKANFNEFALTKMESNYQSFLTLISLIIGISLSTVLIQKLDFIVFLSLIGVCIVRAFLELKTLKSRVGITNILQTSHRSYGYLNQIINDFSVHKELMVNRAYEFIKGLWLKRRKVAFDLQFRLEMKTINYVTISKILSIAFKLVLTVVLVYRISKGDLKIGDYMAITMAIPLIEANILSFVNIVGGFYENTSYLITADNRIIEDHRKNLSSKIKINSIDSITVKNLSFKYPNREKNALNNINLDIKKGEKIAIVGDNASGKTTLTKLILGLYDSPEGSVCINDRNISEIDLDTLWLEVSAIFQDFTRFQLDVRHNVAISEVSKLNDDKAILEVLNQFGIENILESKKGLETELGYLSEDSINLSGGQWQRIALARAMFKKASLVVLDEPTSAIDPNSELRLLTELINSSTDRTLLVITHRIGIAANVDRIVVMKEGEIEETGTHFELLQKRGYYYEMWMLQKELYTNKQEEVLC
ncbi:ATP-binding cassette domain-containing protein [Paenibacillus sp. 2003]|uniref:ATP-binding cassette domain-containing protein n=1 Tax=Paenibacillus TaxID=44249 RepID=UPI00285D94CA|nr:ATP-binding cassette domain-containing protein [Paenibacillus sp. 2003]MDR6715729.1 ATP-binding cassette subfamily B protein [Paenibacillus sp. 2003]